MLTDEIRSKLLEAANNARRYAYVPYSRYPVGAALLSETGKIYTGVNVENAAYPSSMCAERVAVFKAVSEGERRFTAIAVVTDNGGSPCGSCRQVLAEFNPEMSIILADSAGKTTLESTLAELLPRAFGPKDLATS